MHIDKKLLKTIFLGAACCILLVWVLLYSQQVGALFSYIWKLISPFVGGAAIAFVFNVPMRAIERQLEGIRKPGLRRGMAILITLGLMILVIAVVMELLVPQIQATVESLAASIPPFIRRTVNQITALLEENPELREWVMANSELVSIDWAGLLQKAGDFVGSGVSKILDGTVNVIGNLAGILVNLVISIAFSIYCLARKEILARQGRRILYSILPECATDEIIRVLRLTNSTFSNFISGQCLEAVILGVMFAVTMLVLKMPYIPLISVIIAVTALIPIVGAFVGCVLGAFFILVIDPIQAVAFVGMFLVLQQVEGNLIYPRVVGNSVGLPGMWVLVAVTIGGELMGVAGMLLMIPLASVGYALLREFTDRRLAERNIPADKLLDKPMEARPRRGSQAKQDKEKNRLKQMREKLGKFNKH